MVLRSVRRSMSMLLAVAWIVACGSGDDGAANGAANALPAQGGSGGASAGGAAGASAGAGGGATAGFPGSGAGAAGASGATAKSCAPMCGGSVSCDVCRPAVNGCDAAESCAPDSTACPPDTGLKAYTVVELKTPSCTGSSPAHDGSPKNDDLAACLSDAAALGACTTEQADAWCHRRYGDSSMPGNPWYELKKAQVLAACGASGAASYKDDAADGSHRCNDDATCTTYFTQG